MKLTLKVSKYGQSSKVHSMCVGPIISSVELAILLVWWHGVSLNYTPWLTGIMKCKNLGTCYFCLCCKVLIVFGGGRQSKRE